MDTGKGTVSLRVRLTIAPDSKLAEVLLVSGEPSDWECVEFSFYAAKFPVWEEAKTVELDYVVGPDPKRDARAEERGLASMVQLQSVFRTFARDCYLLTYQGDLFCLRDGEWVSLPKRVPKTPSGAHRAPKATGLD